MNELTRRALVDKVANIIADYDARELSDTDIEGLNGEELACIMECLQFGQILDTLQRTAVIDYSVDVLAEVAECAKQEDAPVYEGDKEVDQWVRLSDVNDAINKCLK